jgi:hypothetical protein
MTDILKGVITRRLPMPILVSPNTKNTDCWHMSICWSIAILIQVCLLNMADGDDHSTSTSSHGVFKEPEERDEVKEVRKIAEKETHRVRLWRFVVTCVLLATALAVTLTTYYSLEREEQDKFERAVSVRCQR